MFIKGEKFRYEPREVYHPEIALMNFYLSIGPNVLSLSSERGRETRRIDKFSYSFPRLSHCHLIS